MSSIEDYIAKAKKAHAEFLDKLVLGQYSNSDIIIAEPLEDWTVDPCTLL